MPPWREVERIETRVLGALRPVDAGTGADVTTRLFVRAEDGDARIVRNRSGLHVVTFWAPLAEHEASFAAPPDEPAIGAEPLRLVIEDPSGRYLSRRVRLALPRDPDPDNADDAASLFRPARVAMYPAAAAAVGANWAVLRVSVTEDGSGDRLGGALVRVRRNGDVIALGLTDGRGEALLAVVGVPMLTFGEDDEAVVVEEISVTVEAVFDPAAGTRMTAAALAAGGRAPQPLVDPDLLDGDDTLPDTAQTLAVAARRSQSLTLAIDVP